MGLSTLKEARFLLLWKAISIPAMFAIRPELVTALATATLAVYLVHKALNVSCETKGKVVV
jgi:hypothetical protein